MGTWKKMAEAFGRASYGKNAAEKPVVRWARDRFNKDIGHYVDEPEAAERAEAFHRGSGEAWMDDTDAKNKMGIDKYRANPDEVERHMDELAEARSDERLEKEFAEGFNSAIARRKQNVKDWYGKDYPQDMAEEGAETFEKQLWKYVDDLKAKGVPAQDILNRIKGND